MKHHYIMKKNCCDLRTCFLCKWSLQEWKPAIEAHRVNYKLKKGDLLFREGDPVTGIYFVYSGKVKVHKKWGEDKELIIRFAKDGDIVGHRGLGASSVYPISATALDAVVVCFIDLAFFYTSLKVNHDFVQELMMFYARELQESERNMRNLAHMPVKGRLATSLLHLQDKFGIDEKGCIDIELSRQDIASFTGTTYETVFRMMNELVQSDLVEVTGKSIIIKNKNGLQLVAQEATQ
jgi:CRP/FNR family transcriptional regulator, cyclic AMP receptor protein